MPPEATRLDAALAHIVRRTWLADVARGAAVAALAAAAVSAVLLPRARATGLLVAVSAFAVVFAVALWRSRPGRSTRAAAAGIERVHPEFRNLIVTADELRAHPDRASAWMRERIMVDAARRVSVVGASAVVPLVRPIALGVAAAAVWAAVVLGLPGRAATAITDAAIRLAGSPTAAAGRLRLVAELRPPGYTNLAPRDLVNPDRIEAVAGTALRLRLAAGDGGWRVRFGATELPLRRDGEELVADTVLSESGYFAVEPGAAAADDDRRMLIPLTVTPDRAPSIRIEAPGRDLLLPPSAAQIPITASATDDFALQSLELRYTKVSGGGEQFEFEEGTLPLALTHDSPRAWTGRVALAIQSLKLAPGDALVYRAVGRDRRPGDAGLASSDTFFVEIVGSGHVAVEGIAMPPDEERYALSQQMVVLKIERLRAREAAMPRAELEEAAASIAAEQRSVRANFIFLMGGHVEDEFEEAEHAHEIQEGRLENNARKEISGAIHQMTLAAEGLTAISTGKALPPARAAVEALQRAFGRSRYILRTLATRSRIDPSRRLLGELQDASDWGRDVSPAAIDPVTRGARVLLTRALEVAAALQAGGDIAPARIAALAEQALRIAPEAEAWQSASARLLRLRDAVAGKRPASELAGLLNEAMAPVLAAAQADARLPQAPGSAPASALRRAWVEEARR